MAKKEVGNVVELYPNKSLRFRADIAREKNLVGKKIGEARRRLHITQAEFAARLSAYGVQVKKPAVNKWEDGENVPSAYQLLAICMVLEISEGLSFFTGSISNETDTLNSEGRMMLNRYREYLESNERYTAKRRNIRKVKIRVSDLAASAGVGDEMFEEHFTLMEFPENIVPEGTDFAVRVDGDSMTPVFQNGQTVFIQKCEALRDGEVGLFIYEGKGYIKIYSETFPEKEELENFIDSDGVVYPKIYLESYNEEKYPPREVTSELRIVGRVLK